VAESGGGGVLDKIFVSIFVAFFCCTDLWILLLAGVYMGFTVFLRYVIRDHVYHSCVGGVRLRSSVFPDHLYMSDSSLFSPVSHRFYSILAMHVVRFPFQYSGVVKVPKCLFSF
jgi:hypothetical protein